MSNLNLRSITNSFLDVRLVSLASWRQANEITPRDKGGPCVVLQEGYDPADLKVVADEFVLGRAGKWLSLRHFYKLPVAEPREEFISGQVSEVMQMMGNLPSKVQLPGRTAEEPSASAAGEKVAEPDEMAVAFEVAKNQGNPKN